MGIMVLNLENTVYPCYIGPLSYYNWNLVLVLARVDYIMNVDQQNVLGVQRALLVGLTRLVWDDGHQAIHGWPGVRGWPENGGPCMDGPVSPTKMKIFWVIKYLNIYSTNK